MRGNQHPLIVAAVAAVMLAMAAGCGGGAAGSTKGNSEGSSKRPTADTVLQYGQAGTDSIIPAGKYRIFTLGIAVQNRGRDNVVVKSFQIVHQQGVTGSAQLVVGPKRAIGQLASTVGFPPDPKGRWEANAVRPMGNGFELPHGDKSATWGHNVLIRAELTEEYGFIRGYRVEGTRNGKKFVDEVDTYIAFCSGADSVTTECNNYAKTHGYTKK